MIFLGTLGGKEQKQLTGWQQQTVGPVLPGDCVTPRREHAELKGCSLESEDGKGFSTPRRCLDPGSF